MAGGFRKRNAPGETPGAAGAARRATLEVEVAMGMAAASEHE